MLIYLDYPLTLWNIVRVFCLLRRQKMTKNATTPGLDGLPAEFYKNVFHLFGQDFIDMINFCYFLFYFNLFIYLFIFFLGGGD